MEKKEKQPPAQSQKKVIPEKYHWKKSYTFVLLANAIYIIFFYLLMRYFQ